jgi:hypothetical protein
MAGTRTSRGKTLDAEGRAVSVLDPHSLWARGGNEQIQRETLDAIVADIGAWRLSRTEFWLWTLLMIVLPLLIAGAVGVSFVVRGNFTSIDLLRSLTLFVLPLAPASGGIATLVMSRRRGREHARRTMLAHGHCPHCAYPLAGLSRQEGVVRCPECSCAWPSAECGAPCPAPDRPAIGRRLPISMLALAVMLLFDWWMLHFFL